MRWGQYLVASIIAAITSLGNDNDGGTGSKATQQGLCHSP